MHDDCGLRIHSVKTGQCRISGAWSLEVQKPDFESIKKIPKSRSDFRFLHAKVTKHHLLECVSTLSLMLVASAVSAACAASQPLCPSWRPGPAASALASAALFLQVETRNKTK